MQEKTGFIQSDPYSDDSRRLALEELEKQDLVYKQRIRYIRLLSRILSTILAAYILGSLSFSLSRYVLTKDRIIPESNPPRTAWPDPTVLWPTFMLIALAAFTLFMNFIGLVAYCCGFGAARKTHKVTGKLIHIELAVKLVAWGVAMGLFKMATEDQTDLWGYTCGPASDAIQDQVSSFMDFGQLCTIQQGSWYTMIAETALYALVLITLLLSLLRRRHKKVMTRERELAKTYESGGAQESGIMVKDVDEEYRH